jgi:hypothetical protein
MAAGASAQAKDFEGGSFTVKGRRQRINRVLCGIVANKVLQTPRFVL